ncbi:MAG: Crp/Fnr family transcriptional regulator [Candidatus Sericytochromatia bacterium]
MDETQKMAVIQKIQEIRGLRIFHNLTDRDIFEVMKRSDIITIGEGATVFTEGDTDQSLYVIIKGEFEVTARSPVSGDLIRFSCAGEGLVFGEMSFLDMQPRSATITATEDSEVFGLTRADYEDLLATSPVSAARFMMGVAEILSRRLRGVDQRIKHST